jgi:hypothetical protein
MVWIDNGETIMADCLVRLVFALGAIVLITAAFYQFGGPPAVAIEPPALASAAR